MSSHPIMDIQEDVARVRRLEELQALHAIARAVASELELPAVLQAVVTTICQNSSWDICDIVAVNEEAQRTELLARYPQLPGDTSARSWPISRSITSRVLEQGTPLTVRDVLTDVDSPTWREGARQRGYRAVVVVPLPVKDLPSAIWLFSRRPYQATEGDLAHVTAIADHVAIALRNAHLYDRQREATARFERLLDTQTRLINQVLAGASLHMLVQVSSRMLGNPVIILNQLLHPITQWPPAPDGSTSAAVRRVFEQLRDVGRQRPRLALLLQKRRLVPLTTTIIEVDAIAPPLPWRLLVAPLAAGSHVLGYLLVAEADRPFESLDQIVSQQVGLAAAIELMRQNAAFEAENRVRADIFQRLFAGSWTDPREMVRLASHLSLDLERTNGLLLVRPALAGHEAGDALARERLLADLVPILLRQSEGIVAVVQGDQVVILVPLADAPAGHLHAEATRMARTLEVELGQPPLVVVGPTVGRVEQYQGAKRECDRAVEICDLLGRSGVVTLAELGSYRLLGSLDTGDGMDWFVDDILGPLIAYERRRNTDLIGTLKAYFLNNCSPYHTAEQLFIHISTLRYRLERVRTLTGLDLDDPEVRFSLQLALRCHELARHATQG